MILDLGIKPYYSTARGNLYHADCLDILPLIPDKSVDLVLTDPPYGIGIASNPVRQLHEKMDWDNATPDKAVFDLMFSKSSNQVICGGNYFDLPPTQCFLIWDKIQPEDFSLAMCEYIWTSFKSPAKLYRRSVLEERGKEHPTQKPATLFKWILNKYSKDNDLILDPFSGSGTTAVACEDSNRRWICIEKEEKYCELSAKRIEQFLSQGKLF